MTGRLGVWFMRVLAHLPLPVLRGMGWLVGRALFVLAAPRRRVALRNLALCYPEVPEASAAPGRAKPSCAFRRRGWIAAGSGLRRARWCSEG